MAIPRCPDTSPSPRPLLEKDPVPYRTIAEQVADFIRQAIAQGRITPGARLLEATFAAEMRTSRAPVREALSLLEHEGLVVKEPNRGARVVELTEETIREVASLRGQLEGFAAALAAKRMTAGQLAALEGLLAEMDRAARQGDYARLVALDYQFHDALCRASGHQTLYEAWSAISGKVRLYLATTNLVYRSLRTAARGHRAILAALGSGDGARASRAVQDHLGEVLNVFVARIIRKTPESAATRQPARRPGRKDLQGRRDGSGNGRR